MPKKIPTNEEDFKYSISIEREVAPTAKVGAE